MARRLGGGLDVVEGAREEHNVERVGATEREEVALDRQHALGAAIGGGLGGRIEPGHAVAAPGQPPGDHPRAAAHLQHAARRLGQRAVEEAHRLLDT